MRMWQSTVRVLMHHNTIIDLDASLNRKFSYFHIQGESNVFGMNILIRQMSLECTFLI